MRRAFRILFRAALLGGVLMPASGCAPLLSALPGDLGRAVADEIPAWEKPPPPPRDAPVVDASKLHRKRLPNGLTLVVLEDPRLPRFDLGVTARRGAGDEALSDAGLSSLMAELMERGAGERTALELAAAVDDLGASLSVSATWDSVNAAVSGLTLDLDALFGVLADVVLRPRFDADEVERVRAQHLAGLEQSRDEPETLVAWGLYDALYRGHRYGLPVEGSPESVTALGADEIRAHHDRVFTPGNCIVFAVGDVDAADIERRTLAAFGDWPEVDPLTVGAPPPATTPAAMKVFVVDRPDLGQAQIAIGHEGIARADERRIPVQLLNTVLGSGGFSSRLMARVRAAEGLTYSVGSSFGERRHPGPFAIRTFTRVPEVGRVVALLLEEMGRMASEPPDTDELGRAQSLRTGSFGLGLETSGAVASSLVGLDVYGLPEDSLDTYRRRIRAVAPEAVARAASELLHPDRVAIVAVGPAEEIRAQLEAFGPVEIIEP